MSSSNKRFRSLAPNIPVVGIFVYDGDTGAIANRRMNKLPWYHDVPNEYNEYLQNCLFTVSDQSKTNAIVMGRVTCETMSEVPIPNVLNCVVCNNLPSNLYDDVNHRAREVLIYSNLEGLLEKIQEEYADQIETIYVIGGVSLLTSGLNLFDKIQAINYMQPPDEFDSTIEFHDIFNLEDLLMLSHSITVEKYKNSLKQHQ